jgi:hypothetical protein
VDGAHRPRLPGQPVGDHAVAAHRRACRRAAALRRRARTIGQVDLEPYLGPLPRRSSDRLRPRVIRRRTWPRATGLPPRVLVRTSRTRADRLVRRVRVVRARDDRWLAERGVRLVGIDSQSSTRPTARRSTATTACSRRPARAREPGARRRAAGDYELIALPLKLTHGRRLAGARRAARTLNDAAIADRLPALDAEPTRWRRCASSSSCPTA